MSVRAGAPVVTHALILDSIPFKENDKVVTLLSPDYGKFSAFAKAAAKSVKRFSGGLEPLSHVKAHLKMLNENTQGQQGALWALQSVEFQSGFLHLRKNFESLNSAAFALRLIKDLIPEGPVDASVFRALGRFLRDSDLEGFDKVASWAWPAFWTWLAYHMGVGDISASLESRFAEVNEQFEQAWHHLLARPEPDLKKLFELLVDLKPRPLANVEYIKIYRQWLGASGIEWKHFEKTFLDFSATSLPSAAF